MDEEVQFLKSRIINLHRANKQKLEAIKNKTLILTKEEEGKFRGRGAAYETVLLEIQYSRDNMQAGKKMKEKEAEGDNRVKKPVVKKWNELGKLPNSAWKAEMRKWVPTLSVPEQKELAKLLKDAGYTVRNGKIRIIADRQGVLEVSE